MKNKVILSIVMGSSLILFGCTDDDKSKIVESEFPKELQDLKIPKSSTDNYIKISNKIYKTNKQFLESASFKSSKSVSVIPTTQLLFTELLYDNYEDKLDRKSKEYLEYYKSAEDLYKTKYNGVEFDSEDTLKEIVQNYADVDYLSKELIKDYMKENKLDYTKVPDKETPYDIIVYSYSPDKLAIEEQNILNGETDDNEITKNIKNIKKLSYSEFEKGFKNSYKQNTYIGSYIKDYKYKNAVMYGNLLDKLNDGELKVGKTKVFTSDELGLVGEGYKDNVHFVKLMKKNKSVKVPDKTKLIYTWAKYQSEILPTAKYQYLALINFMDMKTDSTDLTRYNYDELLKEANSNSDLLENNVMLNTANLAINNPNN